MLDRESPPSLHPMAPLTSSLHQLGRHHHGAINGCGHVPAVGFTVGGKHATDERWVEHPGSFVSV